MKRPADLSKMVTLTMSPSEAREIAIALATFQQLAAFFGESKVESLDCAIERIHLQLEDLLWPIERRKRAPYPV